MINSLKLLGYELKMNYSLEEKIKMLYVVGESDSNCFLASRIYKQKYPDRRHPDSRVFERIKRQFEETGRLKDGKPERYQSVTNEEARFDGALNLVEKHKSRNGNISDQRLSSGEKTEISPLPHATITRDHGTRF